MANRVWKGVLSQVIGRFEQLSLNRIFDVSTPCMRNVEPPAKFQMAARGPQDGQLGLERRGLILGYWALRPTFVISYGPEHSLYEKRS